ncbi:MAG: cation transporter, partial [Candidatus Rokubacteria bacterium]|nr:cation transporter [Candidatus Rokubacteria bacterium]
MTIIANAPSCEGGLTSSSYATPQTGPTAGIIWAMERGGTMQPGGTMERGIPTDAAERARLHAVVISLAVGAVLLAAKYQAYRLTGSTAILSDALESIVNVVAAVFALGGIVFAGRPADRNHPYG